MSVQEYIDKHELTKVVEDAVNAAVKVKPDEPLSFLVRAKLRAVCSAIERSRACVPPPLWSFSGGTGLGSVSQAGMLHFKRLAAHRIAIDSALALSSGSEIKDLLQQHAAR